MAASSSEVVSISTAQRAEQFKGYVEDRQVSSLPNGSPSNDLRRWKSLEVIRYDQKPSLMGEGVYSRDYRRSRSFSGSSIVACFSPRVRRVSIIDESPIQLDPDRVDAQIKELMEGDSPAMELLKLIKYPEQQLDPYEEDAVIGALKCLLEGEDAKRHFKTLCNLSLFPDSYSFLSSLIQS